MRLAIHTHPFLRLLAPTMLALLLVACGGGGGASSSATPGVTNPASQASTVPPAATSKAATLTWTAPLENIDGSALVNLSGFKIYYGQNANALNSNVAVANASISTYMVENLTAGIWYFAVTAVNTQGIESPLSNLVSKTIS